MNEIEQRWKFRDIAIALGIISIILVVGLAGVIAYYTSVVSGKDNTIQTDNSNISSLDSQVNFLNDIVNLQSSETLYDQNVTVTPTPFPYEFSFSANYSGCISVRIEGLNGSLLDSTWVEVAWGRYLPSISMNSVSYDVTRNLSGLIDTEYFPILQNYGPTVVRFGTNGNQTITEAVTITYYY